MRIGNLPIPSGIYFEHQPFVLLYQQDSNEISLGLRPGSSFGCFLLTCLGRHRSLKLFSVHGTAFSSFVAMCLWENFWYLGALVMQFLICCLLRVRQINGKRLVSLEALVQ